MIKNKLIRNESLNLLIFSIIDFLIFFPILSLTIFSRFSKKDYDVGLGPEPLINNIYHKKALEKFGYRAQTFVSDVYHITNDFDIRSDLIFRFPFSFLKPYFLYIRAIFTYKCLYFYFHGGPLQRTSLLSKIEPRLYKLAKIKIVVMPYGSDIQDMARCPNPLFKNALSKDYPNIRHNREKISKRIDLWTKNADHIISGADWIDYLYHWDTLMLGHFSIDLNEIKRSAHSERWNENNQTFKILHAPNHPNIKGTPFLLKAINELKEEGYPIELRLLQGKSNKEILKAIEEVDLVADQFIIGWYAMFAIEAMALEKPVLCFIRSDLEETFIILGLLEKGELPIISCKPYEIKSLIMRLYYEREKLLDIGRRSRLFVEKYHSLYFIGTQFNNINRSLGIIPHNH